MFLVPLLLAILPFCSPAEFVGQTYTTRQILYRPTIFRDCGFLGCEVTAGGATTRGGAIYLFDDSCSLSLLGCVFVDCRAAASDGGGGGVCAEACLNFSAIDTTARSCYAGGQAAFCYASVPRTATGSIDVHFVSATESTCGRSTIDFATNAVGSATIIDCLNSSYNNIREYGSGLTVTSRPPATSVRFARFERDAPANVATFASGDLSCATFVNCTCHSLEAFPGLVDVKGTLAVAAGVFQFNVFDFIIGGGGNATFVRCVFDAVTLNSTGSGVLSTVSCVYRTQPTAPAECRTMTPRPSRTASESPRQTQSRRPSRSPVDTAPPAATRHAPSRASFAELIVILAVCLVGIVVIMVFMVQSCKRQPDEAVQLKSGGYDPFEADEDALPVRGIE